MRPGTALTAAIEEIFGPGVIQADGSVNRLALGEVVFDDPVRLRALEGLVHPEVRAWIAARVDTLGSGGEDGVVVVEAIKLLQSPLRDLATEIWVVTCSPEVQRRRLVSDRGYTPEQVEARLRAQPDFAPGTGVRLIQNDGSPAELAGTVEREWNRFLAAET